MRLSLVFLFFIGTIFADGVTKIANEYLNDNSLVVYGRSTNVMGIQSNAIVTFEIESIYWGKTGNSKINIFYPFIKAPKKLDIESKLVFVVPMKSGHNFKSIREFSASDRFAKQKLNSLEKLLAIEKLPRKIAEDEHFAFCIMQLKSDTVWQRWNGFWEWQYIVMSRPKKITSKMLREIILTYSLIPELSLKKRMRETIIRTKRILGNEVIEDSVDNDSVQISIENAILELKKDNLQTQIQAIHTIGQYRNTTSHDILIKNLQHSSHHIRSICLFYLRFQGGSRDIGLIMQILQNDTSLRVRKNAIITLGKIGAIEAIPEITKYLQFTYTKRVAKNALDQLQILAK